jgi:hypothetical protein
LRDISQEFFGITPKTAEQLSSAAALPIATFKLRESTKCTTLVHVDELAAYIEKQRAKAIQTWQSVNP